MAHKAHKNTKKTGTITAKVTPTSKCSGGTKKSTLKKGTKVTVDKECPSNSMYHLSGKGWVKKSAVSISKNKSKSKKKDITKDAKKYTKSNKKKAAKSVKTSVKKLKKQSIAYSAQVKSMYTTDMTALYGIPYSFMNRTDLRYSKKVNVGRKYVEKILSKMPVLLITPGLPNFSPDMSKKERKNLVKALLGSVNIKQKAMNYLFKKKNMRYYALDFKYTAYYKYVNAMCRYCAIALGIGSVKHPMAGKKGGCAFKSYKWQKARNMRLRKVITTRSYISFYLDAETSISETMSNSTTYSQLKDSINSISDVAKELQFLAGPIVGSKIAALDDEGNTTFSNAVDEIANKVSRKLGYTRFIKNAMEGIKTVATGGTIVFPKIWESSEFSRSYDVSIKLRTPDCDLVSWYLNILVPLIHLIALAAPRNIDANSFKSPFLIRAYYKGIFNIDMGIITSLSITKGREGAWTVDGLPSEVDVQINIEEMYDALSISNDDKYKIFRNTGLIDYLSNLCGINVNEPDTARMLAMYTAWTKNKLPDLWVNGWGALNDSIGSWIDSKYQHSMFKV